MSSIDVVVPCYKYDGYLRACVDSVLSRDGAGIRVLIIDDASLDGSAEAARQIVAEDPRVETIPHWRNRGHIANYNITRASTGRNRTTSCC
jgi:glycosyltransferase involved in cell wall biosynthesis